MSFLIAGNDRRWRLYWRPLPPMPKVVPKPEPIPAPSLLKRWWGRLRGRA